MVMVMLKVVVMMATLNDKPASEVSYTCMNLLFVFAFIKAIFSPHIRSSWTITPWKQQVF